MSSQNSSTHSQRFLESWCPACLLLSRHLWTANQPVGHTNFNLARFSLSDGKGTGLGACSPKCMSVKNPCRLRQEVAVSSVNVASQNLHYWIILGKPKEAKNWMHKQCNTMHKHHKLLITLSLDSWRIAIACLGCVVCLPSGALRASKHSHHTFGTCSEKADDMLNPSKSCE